MLCMQLDGLSEHLEGLAPLLDSYRDGKLDYPERALAWLSEAEQLMGRLRLRQGAEMSALRSRILKAEDALRMADSEAGRSAVRRARNAATSEALERAETILRERVSAAEERLTMFEDKLCEGFTAFLLQAALPEKDVPHMQWLDKIWQALNGLDATRPLALYFAASLAPMDRSYILDRVLHRVSRQGLAPLEMPPPVEVG